jgi:hypothetical protein
LADFELSSGLLEHCELGHARKGPRLAPRKILESPKVGDSIDRQDRRRIIALLLDQLADASGASRSPVRAIGGIAGL